MSGNRLFEGGPDAGSMDLGFGPDPEPQIQEAPVPGQVVLSQEQFQELLANLGQRRQELDYAAAIDPTFQPPELPEVDLSQLPDPRTDFDAFKASLSQGLTIARDQIVQGAQAQIQQVQRTNDLLNEAWATMQARYPELVGEEDTIALAREREVADLTARGIDWTVVLRHNMDAAVDAVANRALASIQRRRSLQEGGDGDGGDRTDMISGGSPRPQAQRRQDPPPTSFVDELKKIQRDMGLY